MRKSRKERRAIWDRARLNLIFSIPFSAFLVIVALFKPFLGLRFKRPFRAWGLAIRFRACFKPLFRTCIDICHHLLSQETLC